MLARLLVVSVRQACERVTNQEYHWDTTQYGWNSSYFFNTNYIFKQIEKTPFEITLTCQHLYNMLVIGIRYTLSKSINLHFSSLFNFIYQDKCIVNNFFLETIETFCKKGFFKWNIKQCCIKILALFYSQILPGGTTLQTSKWVCHCIYEVLAIWQSSMETPDSWQQFGVCLLLLKIHQLFSDSKFLETEFVFGLFPF